MVYIYIYISFMWNNGLWKASLQWNILQTEVKGFLFGLLFIRNLYKKNFLNMFTLVIFYTHKVL